MTVSAVPSTPAKSETAAPATRFASRKALDRFGVPGWLQALPIGVVFGLFFVLPLIFVVIVSFWDYNDYQMLPTFTFRSYTESFDGCWTNFPDCTILKT
jgi:putative spermidine/putrescine transport system permease protein